MTLKKMLTYVALVFKSLKVARKIHQHYVQHECVPLNIDEIITHWSLFKNLREVEKTFKVKSFKELKNHIAIGGIYHGDGKSILVLHDGTMVNKNAS